MKNRRPGDVRMEAQASGQGHVYQVGQGQLNVAQHHHVHHSGTGFSGPLDLPSLRRWLERIDSEFRRSVEGGNTRSARKERKEVLKQIDSTVRSADDSQAGSGHADTMRRLLIGGLTAYLSQSGRPPTAEQPVHADTLVDLMLFALWPVVTARKLPKGWQEDLSLLTSPRICALVSEARSLDRQVDSIAFARVLSSRSILPGLQGFMDDLNDRRRGGAVLAALCLVGGLPAPPRESNARSLLIWCLGVAVGVVAANVADRGEGQGANVEEIAALLAEQKHDSLTAEVLGGLMDHGAAGTSCHGTSGGFLDHIFDGMTGGHS